MLTGEPYAGDLHVRFGGRGGASQCAVPTPMPCCVQPFGVEIEVLSKFDKV